MKFGEQEITESDFRAHLERLPPSARKLADANPNQNRTMLENLLIARVLAARARDEGIDSDPVLRKRLQLQEEAFLASQFVARKGSQAPMPEGLEERARERFIAYPEQYRLPEQVHIQRVLIDLYGRTREMALERAQQVYEKALGGDDFLTLVKEYSDDPSRVRNRGDLGFIGNKEIEAELWTEAVTGLVDGQVSRPIFTKAGYYVLKRIAYRHSVQPSFDDLKPYLVEGERERIRDQAAKAVSSEILDSSNLQWNAAAVDALTRRLSPEELRRLEQDVIKSKAGAPRRP